jgi:hypothetical protein
LNNFVNAVAWDVSQPTMPMRKSAPCDERDVASKPPAIKTNKHFFMAGDSTI